MAISGTFSNLAMMIAAQVTQLYAYSRSLALLLGGGLSFVNVAVLMYIYYVDRKDEELKNKKPRSPIAVFFGCHEVSELTIFLHAKNCSRSTLNGIMYIYTTFKALIV
jgi:hypothetical protein